MNQQQRAGKHPSFSRDRKPPGLRREKFLKRFDIPNPKERKRKEEKNASKAFAIRASNELANEVSMTDSLEIDFFSFDDILNSRCSLDQFWSSLRERQKSDDIHDILGCFQALDLLGIKPVCQETVDACLAVCGNKSWAKTFLAGYFEKARGYLLHVAVEKAMVAENFDVIPKLLPQVQDRKLVMCMVSTAASELTDSQFLHFIKTVYRMKENSTELCLKEALSLQQWPLLRKLFKVWQPPRRATEAVADAAITQGQWELTEDCLEHGVGKGLINRTLVEAIKSRHWDTILACVTKGGNIAEACTENGLDLNDRNDSGRTVLHEAILGKRGVEIVELLLQAGANPDVSDILGETALHTAVQRKHWSLLSILLAHSQGAGKIVSTRIPKRRHSTFILLMRRTLGRGITLLHKLCEEGQADIVHTLLLMKADPLVRDDEGNTLMMAASEATEGGENVYRTLIQSGISTHQAVVSESLLASLKERNADVDEEFSSPMRRAVEKGQLRIAKMLYASGACSNREIHELNTFPTTGARLEKLRCHDILKFLDDISSQPRSLRDLCSLKVSHLIGCGVGREDRVARAGLPPPVCRQVLLEHVTDPEFISDCPDPPDNPFDLFFRSMFRLSGLFFPDSINLSFRIDIDFDKMPLFPRGVYTSRLQYQSCSCRVEEPE